MKKNNKGYTVGELFVGMTIFAVFTMLTAWAFNLEKLTQCDFAAPYKGEVIHAVGIFPPASIVTVWFDDK